MKVDRQLIFICSAVIAVLVFGTIGFYNHAPNNGVLTAIYQAIQLFSMESGVLSDPPTPLFVEIARWLALSTLLVVVFTAVQALLGHFRSIVRISFARNHAIVCGAGKRGVAIARALVKGSDRKIIVVESDEHNPSLGELKNIGAEILIGNALDSGILVKAGISKAKSLVAVTGSDERNIAICREVETRLNSSCELSAGVESWAWRSYYLDRFNSKIRIDSFLSRATLNLMREIACSAARQADFKKNGVRILIEATEPIRQELIRAAILMLQVAGDVKPIIEVTSTNHEEELTFKDRFPAANLAASIRWHTQKAGQVFPEGCELVPDFAVFALGSDRETIETAQRYWMRQQTEDKRVVACLNDDNDLDFESETTKKRSFSVKNLLTCGLGTKDPLEPAIEESAKICHAIYFHNEKSKNPNYGTREGELAKCWELLPERIRESNRLAAMHHEVKREAYRTKDGLSAEAMLAHLARCEHMRWIAEKTMDGWRWSGSNDKSTRDNLKLKHHLLIPFEALNSSEKDKDYNSFLWALDIPEEELKYLNLSEEAIKVVEIAKNIKSYAFE